MEKSGEDEDAGDDDDEHGVRTGPRVLWRLHDDADGDGQHQNGVGGAHVASYGHLPVRLAPAQCTTHSTVHMHVTRHSCQQPVV